MKLHRVRGAVKGCHFGLELCQMVIDFQNSFTASLSNKFLAKR